MKTILLLTLLVASLAIVSAAKVNTTKNATSKLSRTKTSKKKVLKKSSKASDQAKSESYHYPILIAPSGGAHEHDSVPVSLELHDGHVPHSPDMHPIEPIHILPIDSHLEHNRPLYVESVRPIYTNGHVDHVQHVEQPHATASDYDQHGVHFQDYQKEAAISPDEYHSNSYGDLSAIPGIPGIDYPTYHELPHTHFKCLEHTSTPGFYADMETRCQVWHYCQPDGRHDRFLCPNGTVFDQITRVCNWWYNVHCESSPSNYDVNFDLYHEPQRIQSHPQPVEIISDIDQHHLHQSAAAHYEASPLEVSHPNSFLRHVQEFEAGIHRQDDNHYGQPIEEPQYVHVQSAASPPVHRYPHRTAPDPILVREDVLHQSAASSGPIEYDASNALQVATPRSKMARNHNGEVKNRRNGKGKRRRYHRRNSKKQVVKVHPKENDDVPTYREGKAAPVKRFRIVRRRKFHKA